MATPLSDPKLLRDAKLSIVDGKPEVVLFGYKHCPWPEGVGIGYKRIPWDVIQATVEDLMEEVEKLQGEVDYYVEAYGSRS